MATTPKGQARQIRLSIEKCLKPFLWMLNDNAFNIVVKEIGVWYVEQLLKEEDYKTRNFWQETKKNLKNDDKAVR